METYVGVDISRDTLDLAIQGDDKPRQFMNNQDGIRKACDFLSRLKPTLIVFEATGGYEIPLYIALNEVNLPLCPGKSEAGKRFHRATGKLAKTDVLDAGLLLILRQPCIHNHVQFLKARR